MIALISLVLAVLAPQAQAVIGGDLNCTTYNGTASPVSTVPQSRPPNVSPPPGVPSSPPTAPPRADSVTLADASTLFWIVPTTSPFAEPSDYKTLSTPTAREPAIDVHPPLPRQHLSLEPAHLTMLIRALPVPHGLQMDSAPTPSTLWLRERPIVPELAEYVEDLVGDKTRPVDDHDSQNIAF
ncbi:Protein CBG22841 [Caenorhabditis briggsae]|uniref:Protein CBG22841 n=1 Tax=Caenorhabditis briggsae TaxID=6238 RepID=A8Y365_CAEBR|nr:Protein CBG22841 [Caenorhabditis briggsae]CAP39334.2 Protein CBG22841 [Caenorhabditis briggsae]